MSVVKQFISLSSLQPCCLADDARPNRLMLWGLSGKQAVAARPEQAASSQTKVRELFIMAHQVQNREAHELLSSLCEVYP